MKIAYLGAGVWGFCLARLLASKGYEVVSWSVDEVHAERLNTTKEHPNLKGALITGNALFTTDLQKALQGADLIVESVTASGIRPVFEKIKAIGIKPGTPIAFTSKGIEQNSGLILSDVAISILGEEFRNSVGSLSGPSFADEVSRNLPTAIVCAGYSADTVNFIVDAFTTNFFRVYPTQDVRGVAFGGSLKNIIAIACGISDGLGLGTGAKATLMTRGLHEIVKLARSQNCRPETLYGLSGMGDLFLTCSSTLSRNYRFGKLLSQNITPENAKKEIGMVVEGAYSAIAALQLSRPTNIPLPITEAVVDILEGKILPKDAVSKLMQRSVKEEYL
jgi:glycerol-3-phosphate dehydrogenase (NAD(P)+)